MSEDKYEYEIEKLSWFTSDYNYQYNSDELKDDSHVVVYSGGCDSTLLLYELAKMYGTKKKPILALSYVHHAINDIKRRKEKETRAAFKKHAKQNKIHIKFLEIEIKSNFHGEVWNKPFVGIAQPAFWLGGLSTVLLGKHNIHFGYVKGDCLWFFKTEFIEAFKALQKLTGGECKLLFPLYFTEKRDILKKLKEHGILELTWHCEDPNEDGTLCNKCTPCQKHNEAIAKLQVREWKSKNDSKEVLDILEQIKTMKE